jgi:predicted nucleotidyltransferase
VRLRTGGREVGTLILEIKGYDPLARVKVAAAHRWVAAVNADGTYGRWAYRLVESPSLVPGSVASAARELAAPPRPGWRVALAHFVDEVRAVYGPELHGVVLYGSRARGDADPESDVDVLVVLDRRDDAGAQRERIGAIACRITSQYDCVISALPVSRREFTESDLPVVANARREGKIVAGETPA